MKQYDDWAEKYLAEYKKDYEGLSMEEIKEKIRQKRNYPEFTIEEYMNFPILHSSNGLTLALESEPPNLLKELKFRNECAEPESKNLCMYFTVEKNNETEDLNITANNCWIE